MTSLVLLLSLSVIGRGGAIAEEGDAMQAYRLGIESRGDAAVARQHFEQSGKHFDDLWAKDVPTLSAARHRAQAWLLAGDMGRSIGAYRQALHEYPEDPALQEGYEYARQQVTLPKVAEIADACRPLPMLKARQAFSPMQLYWGILALNATAWLVLIYGLTRGRWSALIMGVILMAPSWIILSAWDSTTKARHQFWASPMVVITKPTTLHTGNNAEFPKRFSEALPAGVEAEPLEERGGWVRVRLRGEVTGWLSLSDVVQTNKTR